MPETPSITTSPTIGALAAALAKVQGTLPPAPRSRENPHFRSLYSTLADVWDVAREPLAKAGIAVIQLLDDGADGVVGVTTILAHSSGEWVQSTLRLHARSSDPQAVGSAITYGRRYGLAAAVGVAPDDDDANGASGATATDDAPAAHTGGEDVEFRFGSLKGKKLSEVGDIRELRWYESAFARSVDDPAKGLWLKDNERALAAVRAKLARLESEVDSMLGGIEGEPDQAEPQTAGFNSEAWAQDALARIAEFHRTPEASGWWTKHAAEVAQLKLADPQRHAEVFRAFNARIAELRAKAGAK